MTHCVPRRGGGDGARAAPPSPLRCGLSRVAALVAALLLMLGLPPGPATAQMPGGQPNYVLGPGDLVKITVYDQPNLTTEVRVDGDNTISFPLLGQVAVGGGSVREAERRIAQGLRSGGFVSDPEVTMLVLEFDSQQVSVLGQVNEPGLFVLKRPSTIIDLLAAASDVNPEGDDIALFIEKGRDGHADRQIRIDLKALFEDGDFGQNRPVADGDVIYVPKAPVFYIHGEVNRPGSYRLERDMTVMQALSLGGGIAANGSEGGLTIRRRADDGRIESLDVELTDPVREDDVIYVEESLF